MSYVYGKNSGYCDLSNMSFDEKLSEISPSQLVRTKTELLSNKEEVSDKTKNYLLSYSVKCLGSRDRASQGAVTVESRLSVEDLIAVVDETIKGLKEWEEGADLSDPSSGDEQDDSQAEDSPKE